MSLIMSLSYWFFIIEIWIIIGIILIFLEILDGSMIFFLPIALASFINALILFINNNFSQVEFISTWHYLLVTLSISSLIFSFILRKFSKKKPKKDINDY